jgi:hypothetical protein
MIHICKSILKESCITHCTNSQEKPKVGNITHVAHLHDFHQVVSAVGESAAAKESAGHDTGGQNVDPITHQAPHSHSASASYVVLWEGVKHALREQVPVHTVVENSSAMVVVFGTGALPVGGLRPFAGVWNSPQAQHSHLGEATTILIDVGQVTKGARYC